MRGQTSVHDLAERTLFFQLSLSFLLVFTSPLMSATSHQGTILKLNQLHTQTHTSQQLSLYVSSLGLMPAFLSQTLCVILSSSLSLWSCGLVGLGIQFSCHPDASPSAHTHEQTLTQRWISCQDSLRPIRLWYWSMPIWGLKAVEGPHTQWGTPFHLRHTVTHRCTDTHKQMQVCQKLET